MRKLKSFSTSALLATVLTVGGSAVYAQTGPGPAAEKNAIVETQNVAPKSVNDAEAAARIWNIKPKADETTAAMNLRVKRMLKDMLADPGKLDYDTSYWRLLAFMREVPWKKLSSRQQAWYLKNMPNPRLTDEQRDRVVEKLKNKPLYKFEPKELDLYLAFMQKEEPDLRKRVVRLARQNLGQPYAIYLLGEFPHELYDADPTFSLGKGDCVVFSEHMYAMALGHDWKSFYAWLQRIRYKDGVPGMTTRNHFTEADWDVNNNWLVHDLTNELGTTVTPYTEKIDRARFFGNFGIGQDIPVQILQDGYIAAEDIPATLDKLQDGDFVNIVRGFSSGVWVGHVGLVAHKPDGTVTFINSTEPKAEEEPMLDYIKRNLELNKARRKRGSAEFKGMKFLRLRAEDMERLLKEGKGPEAIAKSGEASADTGSAAAPEPAKTEVPATAPGDEVTTQPIAVNVEPTAADNTTMTIQNVATDSLTTATP